MNNCQEDEEEEEEGMKRGVEGKDNLMAFEEIKECALFSDHQK